MIRYVQRVQYTGRWGRGELEAYVYVFMDLHHRCHHTELEAYVYVFMDLHNRCHHTELEAYVYLSVYLWIYIMDATIEAFMMYIHKIQINSYIYASSSPRPQSPVHTKLEVQTKKATLFEHM